MFIDVPQNVAYSMQQTLPPTAGSEARPSRRRCLVGAPLL
jgi:hypothetical protein